MKTREVGGEQDEEGEGFEMLSNKQTKQHSEDASEHQENESFLRDPALICSSPQR